MGFLSGEGDGLGGGRGPRGRVVGMLGRLVSLSAGLCFSKTVKRSTGWILGLEIRVRYDVPAEACVWSGLFFCNAIQAQSEERAI